MEHSDNILAGWISKFGAYKKQALFAGATLAIALGFSFLYYYQRQNAESLAHRSFVDALDYASAQVSTDIAQASAQTTHIFSNENEKWKAAEQAFKSAYSLNKGANIAPFYLSFQADALAHQGKVQEAIPLLDKAVKNMPSPQLHDAYSIKLAILKLDSGVPALKKQGLKLLTKYAGKDQFFLHDYVLYQLGEYHWAQHEFDEVRSYWNMLVLKYSKGSGDTSPWISEVKERLSLLESA